MNVTDYIDVVTVVTKRYARMFPRKRDDIRSVANLRLVELCNDPGITAKPELRKYLYISLQRAVMKFLDADKTVKVPKTTIDRMRKAGKAIPMSVSLGATDVPVLHHYELDTQDLINSFDLEIPERRLLGMLMDGYKAVEIAAIWDCSRAWISILTSRIRVKYYESTGRYGWGTSQSRAGCT